jgi:UTP--glucose-1-phosphate uridylyltransferase
VVRKAVLPVAGLGTRFLPVTKSVPKELLPVVDTPALQLIVEECVRSGLDDVLFVSAMGKAAMEDHFDRRLDLEGELEAKGKTEELAMVRALAELAHVHSVRQGQALGLGHAVLQAAGHVGPDDSFAVLLGDDILDPEGDFLERMVAVHERTSRPVIALMEVPEDQVSMYGIATVEPGEGPGEHLVTGLVEKPDPADAPSNLAVIGRYVLPGSVFAVLEELPPGRGGEIQLTDALEVLAAEEPIVGLTLDVPRFDTGDKLGYLQANVEFALRRADLGPPLRAWLTELLAAGDDHGSQGPS